MLTIRLQRTGKRNQPEFRIVVAQKTASATKKFVEVLGNYNPRNKNFVVKDEARLKYWITQQVEMSPTVHNLFVSKSLLDEKKVRAFNVPKKPVESEAAPVAEAASAPATEPASTEAVPAEVATETPAPEVTQEAPVEAAPETVEAPGEPVTETPETPAE